MAPPKLLHDRDLFEALLAEMRPIEPELRSGAMFGCPAAYIGRRMVFCVYGKGVGVKLPAADAARLVATGQAVPFLPFNKTSMREWVEVHPTRATAAQVIPVLTAAVAYARTLPQSMKVPKRT